MTKDDLTREHLHRKLAGLLGEPEAAMVMDRLATREDIREIVREEISAQVAPLLGEIRSEISATEERLRSDFHQVAHKNLVTTLTVVGVFNAAVFAALGLVFA